MVNLIKAHLSNRGRHIIAYVVISAAFIIGIWGITVRTDHRIREDINNVVRQSCIANIPVIKKFNQAIQADIDTQKDALAVNLKEGDTVRARINQRTIRAKEAAKLHVPTVDECNQRVL